MLNNSPNPNKDSEVRDPPNMDGISSITWSPKANFMVASSWDNQVRCFEVQKSPSLGYSGNQELMSQLKATTTAESPVLCTTWSGDGIRIFFGGCDNKARCWSMQDGQTTQVAQHMAPIKSVFWVDDLQMLLTGSWDKTLKYWDTRSSNPVHTSQLPERLYCMDVKSPLCVLGTADRQIIIYDLRKPQVEFKRLQSPLKYQSRVISCFPDKTGFALGSIEGRVAIHHVDDNDAQKNFAFKCHRDNNIIYSVNVIAFHPIFGTFVTAGSDGTFHFWDKDSKQRLKAFMKCNQPISAGNFSADGTIFSYAVSYDWSQGIEGYNPSNRNLILLHPVQESEIKGRGPKKGDRRN